MLWRSSVVDDEDMSEFIFESGIVHMKDTYPVMTWNHEVVSTHTAIPIWVCLRDNIDIVLYKISEGIYILWLCFIQIGYHHCHTKRHEKHVSMLRIGCEEGVISLEFLNETAFNCINLFAWSIMHQWLLSLLINKDLEPLFHLPVAPVPPQNWSNQPKHCVKLSLPMPQCKWPLTYAMCRKAQQR